MTRFEQEKLLTAARAKFDDFRAVPQDFQVSALKRVEKAFRAFYQRCEAGAAEKGYPRYKKRVRSLTWCLRKHKRKDFIGNQLVYNLYHRKQKNVLVAENLSVSNMG